MKETKETSARTVAKISAVLELDQRWAESMTEEELAEYITDRLESAMGFRVGKVRRVRAKVTTVGTSRVKKEE